MAVTFCASCAGWTDSRGDPSPTVEKGLRPIVLLSATQTKAIVGRAQAHVAMPDRGVETVAALPDTAWHSPGGDHVSYGAGEEVVWLRFEIENKSGQESWLLVSEYAWLDSVRVFLLADGRVRWQDESGDEIPWAERAYRHRLPVIPLRLSSANHQLLVRIESRSEKMVALTLARKLDGARFPRDLFPEFARLAVLAIIISLALTIYRKRRVHLLYIGYVGALLTYLFFWDGYGYLVVPASALHWLDHLQWGAGTAVMALLLLFWREQLALIVHSPFWDRVVKGLAGGAAICALYAIVPVSDLAVADAMARTLFVLQAIAVLVSGIRVIHLGFRPAVYSTVGFGLLLTAAAIAIFSGTAGIPANEFTCVAFYPGYALEAVLFLVSIVARLRLLERVSGEPPAASAGPGVPSGPGNAARHTSRLRGFDLESLAREMRRLMEEERLFSDEDLSQERLASLLGISRHQLSELLRLVVGRSFSDYRNALRIREAQALLVQEPDRTVLSIALSVGYNTKSRFNAAFRAATGLTPTAFRRLNSDRSES